MNSKIYRKKVPLEVRSKVWFEAGGRFVIGEGGVDLLQDILELGSIRQAAQKLGWSYRHTWGYIKNMEKVSGMRFICRIRGGAAGGGAELTPEGKEFLRRYRVFRKALAGLTERRFRRAFHN